MLFKSLIFGKIYFYIEVKTNKKYSIEKRIVPNAHSYKNKKKISKKWIKSGIIIQRNL